MPTDRCLVDFFETIQGLRVSEVRLATSLLEQNLILTASSELTNSQLQELLTNFYVGKGFIVDFVSMNDGTTGILLQDDEIKAAIIISNYSSWAGTARDIFITVKTLEDPSCEV